MDEPTTTERDLIEKLADSFIASYRAGHRPSVERYVEQYPELADQLRDIITALVVLEQNAPHRSRLDVAARQITQGAPREIGEFTILREIGRGGMGVVYEAVQQSLGRHVALKVLSSPGLLNPVHLERFRLEARSAGRLHHSHIVPVFGVGEHDGLHYYAMQFIVGQSLDQVIDALRLVRRPVEDVPELAKATDLTGTLASGLVQGRFHLIGAGESDNADEASLNSQVFPDDASWTSAPSDHAAERSATPGEFSSGSTGRPFYNSVARVGLQVAEALAYAHAEGVLHRDIKPANLLLDAKGNTWVTDFGLAKAEESEGLTAAGDFVGTLRYMAPERLDGWSDRRSDIYGLGATLYELLTLHPFFETSSRAKLIDSIRHEQPLAPARIDPAVPRDLETIVLKALAKEPAARYYSAEEMAADLRSFLADMPIKARRSTARERLWRWCRRNPTLALLTTSVALLVSLVAVVSTIYSVSLNRQLAITATAEESERAARVEAKLRLWEAHLSEMTARAASRRIGQRFATMETVEEANQLLDEIGRTPDRVRLLRNAAIATMPLPDLRRTRKLGSWRSRNREVSPVGMDLSVAADRYVVALETGEVILSRLSDGHELLRLRHAGGEVTPTLTRDGTVLVVRHNFAPHECKAWRIEGDQATALWEQVGAAQFTVSPDGKQAAIATLNQNMNLLDLESGNVIRTIGKGQAVSPFEFHVPSRRIAVCTRNTVQVISWDTGEVLSELPKAPDNKWFDVAWHPNGEFIAATHVDEGPILWDVATQRRMVEYPHRGVVRSVFVAKGDLLLTYNIWDGGLQLWHTGTGRLMLSDATFAKFMHDMGPNGEHLLLVNEPTGPAIWEVAAPQVCTMLPDTYNSNRGLRYWAAISPDGQLLALSRDRGLELWQITTRKLVASTTVPCEHVLFTSEGHLVVRSMEAICRWPRHESSQVAREASSRAPQAESITFGPPERIFGLTMEPNFDMSRNADLLAVKPFSGWQLIWPGHPEKVVVPPPLPDARSLAQQQPALAGARKLECARRNCL